MAGSIPPSGAKVRAGDVRTLAAAATRAVPTRSRGNEEQDGGKRRGRVSVSPASTSPARRSDEQHPGQGSCHHRAAFRRRTDCGGSGTVSTGMTAGLPAFDQFRETELSIR